MTELEAKELLEAMQARAEWDVVNMKQRVKELERDYAADPWEGTAKQIERLGNRLVVRGDEAKALAIAVTKFEGAK